MQIHGNHFCRPGTLNKKSIPMVGNILLLLLQWKMMAYLDLMINESAIAILKRLEEKGVQLACG